MVKSWIWKALVPLLFAVVASAITISLLSVRASAELSAEEKVLDDNYNFISAYDDIFKEVGAAWGIDWVLLAAIARSESEFRSDAISSSGAVGLMQVMPRVAANMGVQYD
jgi:membrane-bound lytic murein transglycosylase F